MESGLAPESTGRRMRPLGTGGLSQPVAGGRAQETRAQPTGAVHNPHKSEAQWSSKSTTKDKTWVDDANSRFKLKDPAKTGRALYKHLWRADIAPRPAVGKSWRQAAGALWAEGFSAES